MVVPSFSPVTVHSLSQLLIFTGIFLQAEYLPACELPRFPSLLTACLTKCLCHIINHFICHAWINADPEGITHDTVGIFQSSGYAVAAVFFPHLIKARMLDQVSGKEHTRLHALFLDIFDYLVPIYALLAGQKETKPARIGMLTGNRQDICVLGSGKSRFQTGEIVFSALHEGWKLFKLRTADRRLQVGRL